VHAGEAVCPGALCAALFRYFESEAASLPCASARRRLGLTRREQQLVPLIAKGLTNKEIASIGRRDFWFRAQSETSTPHP
jgi:DNA-binding NarL/FixJ family response regulator